MSERPYIVGLGGTTRPGSTTERALGVVLRRAEELGCDARLIGAINLPTEPYDPARPERSDHALELVYQLRRADGLVIATPSYHGGVSGLIKNAIDFVEDMREDDRPYLAGRAVGCVVCADGPQAMGSTLGALRAIVHALRGWPTPYGATLNTRQMPFGGAGAEPDPGAIKACETIAEEVVQFARMAIAMRAGSHR